jgi:hypothetical protein
VNLLDFFPAYELLNNSRQKPASMVPQLHALRDLANTGGLRESGEVGNYLLAGHLPRLRRFLLAIDVSFLHGWAASPQSG